MAAEASLAFATRRTTCVLLNRDHESLYRELYTDPELMRNVGPPLMPSEAKRAFAATLRQQARGQRYDWVAADLAETPFALAGLVIDRTRPANGEIGIILRASHHHRGLATEVLARVARVGFRRLGLETITTYSTRENKATFAFLSKLGFSPVALDLLPGSNRSGYFWELKQSRKALQRLATPEAVR